jgi:hypothetical protein
MSEQQQTAPPAGERVYERCLCREAMDWWKSHACSQDVRQHLRNSRVEFLKAIRTAIDERITRLSNAPSQGTKINVE